MSIIYTCPKCGSDLEEIVLATYPPQYQSRCPKCGWDHIKKDTVIRIPYPENDEPEISQINLTIPSGDHIPPACVNCSNHPSNGGSGICNCIMGLNSIY